MKLSTRSRSFTVTAAVLAVALVAGATVLVAGPRGRQMQGRGPDGAPGPRLERVLERLDLSDAQHDSIRAILDANRDAVMARAEEMRTARETLRAAIHADTLDEAAIRAASANVAAVEADTAVERARVFQSVRAELTDEQRVELQEILAEAPQRRMRRSSSF